MKWLWDSNKEGLKGIEEVLTLEIDDLISQLAENLVFLDFRVKSASPSKIQNTALSLIDSIKIIYFYCTPFYTFL